MKNLVESCLFIFRPRHRVRTHKNTHTKSCLGFPKIFKSETEVGHDNSSKQSHIPFKDSSICAADAGPLNNCEAIGV